MVRGKLPQKRMIRGSVSPKLCMDIYRRYGRFQYNKKLRSPVFLGGRSDGSGFGLAARKESRRRHPLSVSESNHRSQRDQYGNSPARWCRLAASEVLVRKVVRVCTL
jgi:hypothetical protein